MSDASKPVPNTFDDFADRFRTLQVEAFSYGYQSLIMFTELDRLTSEEGSDTLVYFNYRGCAFTSLGMAEYAKKRLLALWESLD